MTPAPKSDIAAAAQHYVRVFESLTPASVDALLACCSHDVRFRDPFNDVRGVAGYERVLRKMFDYVTDPRVEVLGLAVSGTRAYLRWDFSFSRKSGKGNWVIEGMTELLFDEAGKVTAHLDHWDSGSQFYARLPILRPLIAFVKKRLAV